MSKLAKSDRPHRERSPDKPLPPSSAKELQHRSSLIVSEVDDYRLTLNKPSSSASGGTLDNRKTNRSISQPNPSQAPNNLSELTTSSSGNSSGNISSRISAINKKQLKRSSTAREPHQQERIPRIPELAIISPNSLSSSTTTATTLKSGSTLRHSNSSSAGGKMGTGNNSDLNAVFDNLGYDKSPSGTTSSATDTTAAMASNNNKQRQRKVSSSSHSLSEQLREQLESQLRREKVQLLPGGAAAASNYSLMELTSSLSDSDSCSTGSDSGDNKRQRKSPPTQTQSLSEESSSNSGAEAGGGLAGPPGGGVPGGGAPSTPFPTPLEGDLLLVVRFEKFFSRRAGWT